MDKLIRHGIIGLGKTVGIAASHIDALRKSHSLVLTAVYDKVPQNARDMLRRMGMTGVTVCDSVEQRFAMVDSVSICTPNDQHVELAVEALRQGLHVLVEKPLADSAQAALALEKEAGAHPDQVCMVCFNYREYSVYNFLKEYLDGGALGKIYFYRQQLGGNRIAQFSVKREWRMDRAQSGSGALADFGCHMLDLAGWLTGGSCGEVHPLAAACSTVISERQAVDGDAWLPVTNDDCAVFMARSDSGALYTFTASRVGVWDHSIEIVGEKGMLRADLDAGNGVQVWLREAGGAYLPENRTVLEVPNEKGHAGILNAFAACIRKERSDPRTVAYGRKLQETIDWLDKNAL